MEFISTEVCEKYSLTSIWLLRRFFPASFWGRKNVFILVNILTECSKDLEYVLVAKQLYVLSYFNFLVIDHLISNHVFFWAQHIPDFGIWTLTWSILRLFSGINKQWTYNPFILSKDVFLSRSLHICFQGNERGEFSPDVVLKCRFKLAVF